MRSIDCYLNTPSTEYLGYLFYSKLNLFHRSCSTPSTFQERVYKYMLVAYKKASDQYVAPKQPHCGWPSKSKVRRTQKEMWRQPKATNLVVLEPLRQLRQERNGAFQATGVLGAEPLGAFWSADGLGSAIIRRIQGLPRLCAHRPRARPQSGPGSLLTPLTRQSEHDRRDTLLEEWLGQRQDGLRALRCPFR